MTLSGVWGSAAPFLAATMARTRGWPLLYVCPHLDDADDASDDIEVLTGMPATLFPAWEADAHSGQVSDEIAGQRLRVCNLLSLPADRRDEPIDVIVAPIMSLIQPVPDRQTLVQARLDLCPGLEMGLDELASWLVDAGFEPAEIVEQTGEFARRGGIVDVFPPSANQALRIEFFGDQIESIRRFDLDTQRSTEQIPGYELAAVAAGREYDPAKTTCLLSYLPAETVVCLPDPAALAELASTFYHRLGDTTGIREPAELFRQVNAKAAVEMHAFAAPVEDAIELGIESLQRLSVQPDQALAELGKLAGEADVTVFCENAAEETRFREVLRQQLPDVAEAILTRVGHLHDGFYWTNERKVWVGHHEIFHRYAKVRRVRRIRSGRPIDSFVDLQEGDYVVHVAHGVARFEGLRHLEKDGRQEEYLTLRFAHNALLHVPVSQIGLVQKYIGSTRRHPKLNSLGGAGWGRQKARVAESVRDLAAEMLRLQAMRESVPGITYPPDTQWQRQFEQEFLYTETEDQLATLAEIKRDLQAPRPMDRLLCGDVGYGKTELAIRAAFKVAEGGKQVAVLVPTTVLAAQHMRTFTERFADYPFLVEVISRFRTKSEQEDIAKRLVLGRIDVIIGTHRLLSGDLRFADLGLVVIDEEQRFGVTHKEALKRMRATVDILTMTATPIPRTLHMALLGLRDISNLTTPPLDRRAITTEICRYDERRIRDAILREMNRQGQVFFLHNRVQSIHRVAEEIQKIVPEARVVVGHGQMPARQLEHVMLDFVNQRFDVLVCTTIIESGLDIPSANTIFINNANNFGLAELHQLRGRVGRYKHRAYCYLLLPHDKPISPIAAKRLKAIEEFSDLGAGFQIAMRDLEIRGAGNILGSEQSGHIAALGYELYCQLLDETVRELRGEKSRARREVNVDLGISAYIPRNYIPSDRQRMEMYRRIVRCGGEQELADLLAELKDAYGPVPHSMRILLDLAEVRVLADKLGIESIVLMKPDIILCIRDWELVKGAFHDAAGTVRLPDPRTMHWRLPPSYLETPTLLAILRSQLKRGRRAV